VARRSLLIAVALLGLGSWEPAASAAVRPAPPGVLVVPPALDPAFVGQSDALLAGLTRGLREDRRVRAVGLPGDDVGLRNCLGSAHDKEEGACWAEAARRLEAPLVLTAAVRGSSVRCGLELGLGRVGGARTPFNRTVQPCDASALQTKLQRAVGSLLTKAEQAVAPTPPQDPPGVELAWVPVPGGRFAMGSDSGDADERPAHRVTVDGFSVLRTEVTVAQYEACVQAGACAPPRTARGCNEGSADKGDHPVNCVDWAQATAFCAWAGGRLPSEKEWERAARGGEGREYPWGSELPSAGGRYRANYDCYDEGDGYDRAIYGRDGFTETAPVCSFAEGSSVQGVCDLAGNVWEWVQDRLTPYSAGGARPGPGSSANGERVMRGGSWGTPARNLRTSGRFWKAPDYSAPDVGLRCVR